MINTLSPNSIIHQIPRFKEIQSIQCFSNAPSERISENIIESVHVRKNKKYICI